LEHYYTTWQPGSVLEARSEALPDDLLDLAMTRRGRDDSAHKVICGDPSFAREYVSQFQALGVDELILVMQMGGVPSELALQSVRTFGEQVLPHFS
jgi:hypothetical protein